MKYRANVFCKHPCEVSSWVCLGNLSRSNPTLDDSSRTYQTAFPQPFVAFLNPSTYQRRFRIRCGVNSSTLIESFDGIPIKSVSSNKKTIVNPVLATRIASSGIRASAFSCLDFFQFQLFRVIYPRVLFYVGSWNFLIECSWTVLNFVVNFSFCVSFLG